MTSKYLPRRLNLIGVITYRLSQVLNDFDRRLQTVTIEVDFSFTIFIPSDPMCARTTAFIEDYYTAFFFYSAFSVTYLVRKLL